MHRSARPRPFTLLTTLPAALFFLTVFPAHAYLTIIPGPATSSVPGYTIDGGNKLLVGNGLAADTVTPRSVSGPSIGTRAVRWNASGAVTLLDPLSTKPSGYTKVVATDMNSLGTVVGYTDKYNAQGNVHGRRPVRWDAGSTAAVELDDLSSSPDSLGAYALAVNDAGIVVGILQEHQSADGSVDDHPVRWDASGVATELGHLGKGMSNQSQTTVSAINNAGDVVGSAETYDASGNTLGFRAVRWNFSSATPIVLADLGVSSVNGATYATAKVINDAGAVAGMCMKYDAEGINRTLRPVRWDLSGAITELGMLGSSNSSSSHIPTPNDINSSGAIVGTLVKYDPDGNSLGTRGVRWDPSSTVAVELAPLGLTGTSRANAINDDGIVVGSANGMYGNPKCATLWTPAGRAINLYSLVDSSQFHLEAAMDITDSGWITIFGYQKRPLIQDQTFFAFFTQSFLLHITYFDPGDFNLDGSVNAHDINPFIAALSDYNAYLAYLHDRMTALAIDPGELDLILQFLDPSGDASLNVQDINPFISSLSTAGVDADALSVIPEPATIALLLLATPLLTCRHRA